MTAAQMWIAYTPAGREFDAQEEAEALGLWACVPRRVDMMRRGNDRRPEPVVTAYLTNYLFVQMDAEQWHWLKGAKHVRSIMGVSAGNARLVHRFIEKIEMDYAERLAQIDAAQRVIDNAAATKEQRRAALAAVQQHQPGDLLEIIAGPFAGLLARFGRIAEGVGPHPEMVAEIEVFGQMTAVRLDPLAVKTAAC